MREARAVKSDGLTLLAAARLAYARGALDEAVTLHEKARDLGDLPWAPWRDEVLATYRRAAAEGRVLPLPDEARAGG